MTANLGPLDSAPKGVRPPFDQYATRTDRQDFRTALVEAIGPVQLGAYDNRLLDWLADWDASVVGTLASLFYRVRAAGETDQGATAEEREVER
jgi:hypothetical protein